MRHVFPSYVVSQSAYVEERRVAGLHPIDELQRFRLLVCVLCCSICISMIYVFDLFTKDFREQFSFTAGEMATVSTVGMSVCWFVLPYGFLSNYVGPTPLFALAMTYGVTGCVCMALTFNGTIRGSLLSICVFNALICAASGVLDAATIVTLAEVFPRNRGPVIGLAKVMTGLGSSMWASVSVNLFKGDISSFLFMMASLLVCSGTAALTLVRLPPYFITPWRRQRIDPQQVEALESLKPVYHSKNVPWRRFSIAGAVVVAYIIFFTVSTPVKAYTEVSDASQILLGIITVTLFIVFFAMALPIKFLGGVDEAAPSPADKSSGEVEPIAAELSLVDGDNTACTESLSSAPAEAQEGAPLRQDPRYGGSLRSNLMKPDVWLLLLGFAFQSAIGNMVLYNSSTISVALNGYPRSKEMSALYTAFLGVGSAVGRIAMGLYEAYVQHQDPQNRRFLVTLVLPLPPIMATIACILLLTIPKPGEGILLPYLIIYFEEGFFNAVRAIIYPSLFESHHPVYYNMSFLSSILSMVCFNRLLFGYTVDAQHDRLGFGADEDCTVKDCVQTPLIVATGTAVLAIAMMLVVHVRYARFVKRMRMVT